MQEEHKDAVLDRLERTYGETDKEAGFASRIREIAERIAEDYYKEIASDKFITQMTDAIIGLIAVVIFVIVHVRKISRLQ